MLNTEINQVAIVGIGSIIPFIITEPVCNSWDPNNIPAITKIIQDWHFLQCLQHHNSQNL